MVCLKTGQELAVNRYFRGEVWSYRGLYIFLGLGIIFIKILPIPQTAGVWPYPDILFCLTMSWIIRRPEYLPTLLIAFMFLLTDLFLMYPPGLRAFGVLLGAEFLRNRIYILRELSLIGEWIVVSLVIIVIFALTHLIAFLTVISTTNFGLEMIGASTSIAAYPLVVWISNAFFKVHKPAMGEVDERGHRR